MVCSEHCVLNPNHQGHCVMALQPKRPARPYTPQPPPVTNLELSTLTDVIGEGNVRATARVEGNNMEFMKAIYLAVQDDLRTDPDRPALSTFAHRDVSDANPTTWSVCAVARAANRRDGDQFNNNMVSKYCRAARVCTDFPDLNITYRTTFAEFGKGSVSEEHKFTNVDDFMKKVNVEDCDPAVTTGACDPAVTTGVTGESCQSSSEKRPRDSTFGSLPSAKKRRLRCKDPDPEGQDVTPHELREGQVVWGYWRDDKRWYPGLVCTALKGGKTYLYVHYMDGEQDYGTEFAGRDWRLDCDQDVQHNIVPTALPNWADVEFEEGPQLELESESQEVDVEPESQEVEVEQAIEVESEIVPEGEINPAELLPEANVMVDTPIWKQNVEQLGFDEDFTLQLFQKMSEVDTQTCMRIARKLCSNFRSPCRVPGIQSQIQCGLVNAEELVEMVLTKTLKDPATLDAEKASRKKYFHTRMAPESSSGTYYCGAHVTSLHDVPDSD